MRQRNQPAVSLLTSYRDGKTVGTDAVLQRVHQHIHLRLRADRQLAPLEGRDTQKPFLQHGIDVDIIHRQVTFDPARRISQPDVGISGRACSKLRGMIDDVIDA